MRRRRRQAGRFYNHELGFVGMLLIASATVLTAISEARWISIVDLALSFIGLAAVTFDFGQAAALRREERERSRDRSDGS